MVLLIDNYDSFVFNLARYVAELGYEYQVVRNDKLSIAEIARLAPSHIILSPGPGGPSDAGICISAIQHFKGKIPLLGVCLGHQAIASAYGGRVVRSSAPQHGKASKIFHDGKGLFQGLPNPFVIGRYHSLMVERNALPASLNVSAVTVKGEIMALTDHDSAVFGVQFHPESVLTEHGHAMLGQFLNTVVS